MFDANMRHLPVGHKGFARVGSVKKDGLWASLGIIQDSLVHFTTNKSGNWENHTEDLKANATIHLETGDVVVMSYAEDKYYSRMVYEGSLSLEEGNLLSGFISKQSLEDAIKIMERIGDDFIVGDNPNASEYR